MPSLDCLAFGHVQDSSERIWLSGEVACTSWGFSLGALPRLKAGSADGAPLVTRLSFLPSEDNDSSGTCQ